MDALREGERFAVTWPGGNGPHAYVVSVRAGTPSAFVTCSVGPVAVRELAAATEIRRLSESGR